MARKLGAIRAIGHLDTPKIEAEICALSDAIRCIQCALHKPHEAVAAEPSVQLFAFGPISHAATYFIYVAVITWLMGA